MTSIYDDLANSEYVNPAQFKQQLKMMSNMKDSIDSQEIHEANLQAYAQASEKKKQFDLITQMRQNINADDLLDNYEPWTKDQKTYDQLIEQRNRMIFEDNNDGQDNEKINHLLAQLQAPMNLDNIIPNSNQDDNYLMSQYDLEKAHQQMQQSIKQLKLVNKISKNGMYGEDDHEGSINNHMGGGGPRNFNGQNSLYELANKVGHPLSSSNLNSDNDAEFQKILQGDGSLGSGNNPYSMHKFGGISGNNINNNPNDIINLANSENEQKYNPVSNRINERNNYLQNNEFFHNNNYNLEKKQMSLAQRANQAKLQNLNRYISEQNNQYNYDNQYQRNLPYNNIKKDSAFSTQNEKILKRKALLMNIDDIPIHELHKADGYQIRQIDEDDNFRGNQENNYGLNNIGSTSRSPNRHSTIDNDGVQSKLDDELKNLSLSDKVFHKNWKVRMNAIKEINQIMIDFVKNGGLQKVLQKEEQIYGDSSNPFDVYGPIIDKIIKDSNLTAQYEGLLCLQTYIYNGDDIKTVTASCISFLLDKIQINKPNFKEITFNIIQMMIKRRQTILPELLKRYKSVNPRVISFCLENLNKSFEDKNLFLQEANLKMIYKYTTDLLAHNIKELRDQSLTLITHVYENCQDDVQTFCSNIKGLRPIQIKELKETLQNHSKNLNSDYIVRLFDQNSVFEDKKETASPERSKSREKVRNQFQIDQKVEKYEKQDEIDLCSVLPENFSDIPRLNQIKQKQKAMEQFNQDLEKLRAKQAQFINQENFDNINQENNNYFIKQKDYSNIFNIISSLLEDPNMLVFIEAIKTVEHLSALLKQNFKREKAKQFIQILADKYKETKTAVLTALEKSFDTIFENKCMPPHIFFDILVNQISFSHKNPRVKQMVLERVEILIQKYYLNNENQNDDNLQKNNSQIIIILKQIKEKLQQIVLKDTNASVRDQGVILISLVKAIMLKGGQNGASGLIVVQEIIDSLPKQRQNEIQKRIESYDIKYPNRNNMNELPFSRENEKQPKSRGVSAKSGANSNRNPEKQSQQDEHRKYSPMKSIGQGLDQQILFNTKKAQSNVSSKYQASLSDVIMTIKNISQDRDRLRIAQITENFEMALDELADEGIKECKSQIISCIYWLLSSFPSKINFLENDRQEAIKTVINFMKKLYCIDRQINFSPSNGQGIPQELFQAVSSVLICFALFENDHQYNKQLSQILNLIFVASTESGLSPSYFVNTLKQTFTKYDPCQKQLPKGKLIIISRSIYFLSDRLEEILEKSKIMQANIDDIQEYNNRSVELKDFEEFRSIVIQQIEENNKKQTHDEDKFILIQSLVYLKEQMNQYIIKQQQNNYKQQVVEPQIITFSGSRYPDANQETNFEMRLQKLKELVKEEVTTKAYNEEQNQMDIDNLQRPGSERYKFQKNMTYDGQNSLQEFNDDEDFRLSTDNQQSLAMLGTVGNSQKSHIIYLQEEKLQRLESSQIKVRQIKNEVDTLLDEKNKLEEEKRILLNEQNRETEEWKRRYNEMTRKNDEIISNLAEANRCYLRQCDQNEKLSKQIIDLQQQHKDFIQKYRVLEEKLQVSEKQVEIQQMRLLEESQKNIESPRSSIQENKQVIEEKLLNIIEQVFDKNQLVSLGQNQSSTIGITRIQELLLDSDGQNQNLSKSLIFHYQKLKQKQDRMQMLLALKQSLENEDILFAVSNEVYKSLLNFLLKSFSFEKELIERESLHRQHERELQNELTQESQRLVSKLLNSKEFTQSLICMIQLLKNEAMPDDFSANLSIQERQYLRVIMRCITRITKALHSENPELIRAFDVLIEMQKLFVKHPPENLRQDLPCLQDLDFVFRGLKDVSDKLIALQPQKCISFLEFCKQGKAQENNSAAQSVEGDDEVSKSANYSQINAFIKYIDQMIQTKIYS